MEVYDVIEQSYKIDNSSQDPVAHIVLLLSFWFPFAFQNGQLEIFLFQLFSEIWAYVLVINIVNISYADYTQIS